MSDQNSTTRAVRDAIELGPAPRRITPFTNDPTPAAMQKMAAKGPYTPGFLDEDSGTFLTSMTSGSTGRLFEREMIRYYDGGPLVSSRAGEEEMRLADYVGSSFLAASQREALYDFVRAMLVRNRDKVVKRAEDMSRDTGFLQRLFMAEAQFPTAEEEALYDAHRERVASGDESAIRRSKFVERLFREVEFMAKVEVNPLFAEKKRDDVLRMLDGIDGSPVAIRRLIERLEAEDDERDWEYTEEENSVSEYIPKMIKPDEGAAELLNSFVPRRNKAGENVRTSFATAIEAYEYSLRHKKHTHVTRLSALFAIIREAKDRIDEADLFGERLPDEDRKQVPSILADDVRRAERFFEHVVVPGNMQTIRAALGASEQSDPRWEQNPQAYELLMQTKKRLREELDGPHSSSDERVRGAVDHAMTSVFSTRWFNRVKGFRVEQGVPATQMDQLLTSLAELGMVRPVPQDELSARGMWSGKGRPPKVWRINPHLFASPAKAKELGCIPRIDRDTEIELFK